MVASQNRTTYSFTSRITRTSLYIVFYDKWIAIWFVVINLCFNHFNEKTCWTSEILGENSWKNLTFVVDEFFFRRQAPPTKPRQPAHQSKQQLSRVFSKNLWSSAGFLIEIVKTKIDHHKILDNFYLASFRIYQQPRLFFSFSFSTTFFVWNDVAAIKNKKLLKKWQETSIDMSPPW